MTDRAEPGVTPLTAEELAKLRGGHVPVWPGANAHCHRDGQTWPCEFVRLLATLDAATPRPGLVERIEKFASLHRLQWSDDVIADLAAFLASGTGEPGLDVTGGIHPDGDFDGLYANDKGADPTPEPK